MAKSKTKVQWFGAEVVKETEGKVAKAVREATLWVLTDAILRCPVDTGTLRNSIDFDTNEFQGIVFSNIEYAHPVETKQPFLRPALYNNTKKIASFFNKRMR